ncbi:MAG: Sorting nexin mvp1, partial [Candelina submexicana]
MSLFGSSPEESSSHLPTQSHHSLFDEEPTPAGGSKSSLFTEAETGASDSPWGLPTPKKVPKGNLVKSLLATSDVPEMYIDAYETVLKSGDTIGAGASLTGVKKVLGGSGLSSDDQAKILEIIVPGGEETPTGIGRSEFNVLLALIGLAQEEEDITLDGVDERRKSLPLPLIPSFAASSNSSKISHNIEDIPQPSQRSTTPPLKSTRSTGSPAKSRNMRRDSLEFPESDPWSSPALHKGHNHSQSTIHNESGQKPNGALSTRPAANGSSGPPRTTSTFTTQSDVAAAIPSEGTLAGNSHSGGNGWGSDQGFESPSVDRSAPRNSESLNRSLGGGRVTSSGVEEVVTVTLLPEKEGIFMFQHRNYEVASVRRQSKVIRRYSDFVWLLDCLHRRYPFRQLPLLPPKRVAVNGRHLSSDILFIEKRRRGLIRFSNALVRHPVLSQEQLVIMFLTVPTELAVWRKQATISVQEEFTGKALPPTLEDALPPTLSDTFDTVRSSVRKSTDIYINLCNLLERLAKRNEGFAADYLRFSLALQSLTNLSESSYAIETNDVPLLNEGINSTAKHLSISQSLLEDEARAWDEGILEDLKRQRDTLVGMRDMFDRRDRFATDTIPMLERRIANNENKLAGLRARVDAVKPGEVERVAESIIKDKESIVAQHARGVFIKECIRDELIFFQRSQYHISRTHQDWSQERV